MEHPCPRMDQRIYGNLICQNGIAEIARCIESVAPHVDEYLVMDGGSTDGTWEWLNKWKDVYHLTLLRHDYDDQGAQRNRLLSKVPKGVWVINIDQDEEILCSGVKEYLGRISPAMMAGVDRDLVLDLRIPCINLVDDPQHYDADRVMFFGTKFFYNDRNLHFTPGYHMSLCYYETEYNANSVLVPEDWVVKHYAYLDNERIAKSASDPKRHYDKSEWDRKTWDIKPLPDIWKR
jgi:glycosyltransferase involved in cell wall biosynthesis